MPSVKAVLERPIIHTLVYFYIGLVVMVMSVAANMVLDNFVVRGATLSNPQNYWALIGQRVADDFILIGRILLELMLVLFIAQVVFRLWNMLPNRSVDT